MRSKIQHGGSAPQLIKTQLARVGKISSLALPGKVFKGILCSTCGRASISWPLPKPIRMNKLRPWRRSPFPELFEALTAIYVPHE